MNDAFVSYARKDRAIAERLVFALQSGGLAVWWDGLLIGGDDFGRTIDAELKRSRCIVVLWSANSVTSDWVPNEARRGRNHKARLVPVRIDTCEEPLEFSGLHIVSLEGWSGDEEHPGLTELLNAVRGVSTAPPPPPPVKVWPALLGVAVLALGVGVVWDVMYSKPTPEPAGDTAAFTPSPGPSADHESTGGAGEVPALPASAPVGSGGAPGGAPSAPGAKPNKLCCTGTLGAAKPCSKKTCAECGLRECE